jgi:hypothetical protein
MTYKKGSFAKMGKKKITLVKYKKKSMTSNERSKTLSDWRNNW